MTFPNKLMRLSIGGTLYEVESWSIGVHFTGANTLTPAADLRAPTEGLISALGPLYRHTSAQLGFVKYNELDHVTGKYVDAAQSNSEYISPEYTATGTPSLLPQAALVATLTTALQRGRGHAGRVFLPVSPPIQSTGHVGEATAVPIANAVANWINSIALLTGDTPVVWSKIGDSVTPITGVKIGSIIDTQRRRRSSIPEVYYPGTVSVP